MQDEMDRGLGPDRLEPREIDARLARRVMAMRRADRDGERVDAGLGDEAAGFVRIGELLLVVLGLDEIGGADPAELGLDGDAAGVGVGDDGARDAHVVGKRRPDRSIITEVKPAAIAASITGISKVWSRWSTTGTVAPSASRAARKASPNAAAAMP